MKCQWPKCENTFEVPISSWCFCTKHVMEKEKNYALYDLKYNSNNQNLVQLAHKRLKEYDKFHQVDL